MTSLIEQKNAKLFLDLEEQVYSKRLAETFKKLLINDFEESNANRDRLEGILQREREIKRVFEKEVGKLKKEYKTLKVENTKLNHLCKEEDRKHTEKNMEDQRYANLNDNNEA
jgi:DNA gyrase/topoisomerase IV subunit A